MVKAVRHVLGLRTFAVEFILPTRRMGLAGVEGGLLRVADGSGWISGKTQSERRNLDDITRDICKNYSIHPVPSVLTRRRRALALRAYAPVRSMCTSCTGPPLCV